MFLSLNCWNFSTGGSCIPCFLEVQVFSEVALYPPNFSKCIYPTEREDNLESVDFINASVNFSSKYIPTKQKICKTLPHVSTKSFHIVVSKNILIVTQFINIYLHASHTKTNLFNKVFNSSATGFNVYFWFGLPSGRPRCDIRTTDLAPLSKAYLIVSNAATILWLLVILPSFNGTLKSTLKWK